MGVEVEREAMKSEIIALCEGWNLPYQKRLMEIFPVRRGPLWYWKSKGCWVSAESASLLAAKLKWKREISRTSCSNRREETKEAMITFLKCLLSTKDKELRNNWESKKLRS